MLVRLRPTPRSPRSTMNIVQGRQDHPPPLSQYLMRAAPRPTNSSTNSEAETTKKGTPASPATALAALRHEGQEHVMSDTAVGNNWRQTRGMM